MALTTWADAILDQRVPIHWLLTLTHVDMSTAYFADSDLDIGGIHYRGLLKIAGRPMIRVDPYTARASATVARMELVPSLDGAFCPYDIAARYGVPWKAMSATLHRWAEGTAITEADLIISGRVDADAVSADGELSLTIVDSSLLYDRRFPLYRINETWAWPGCREEDAAQGWAILYGTFTRVPCPVIAAGTNTVLLALGTCATGDQLYKDDVALGTETYGNGTVVLPSGESVATSYFTAGAAIDSSRIAADGTGYKDDALGTYSGAALALLTNPADQLRHMAATFAGVPATAINAAGFVEWRLQIAGAIGAIQVLPDERSSIFQIAQDLGRVLRSAVFFERGKLTARRLDFTRHPVIHLKENETLYGVMSVEGGKTERLLSRLTIKHGWGWRQSDTRMDYLTTTVLDDASNEDFAANLANYGPNEETINCRGIASATTITTQIAALGELHGKLRSTATVIASRDAHPVKIYDVVQVTAARVPSSDGAGWTGKRWVVTGIEYGTDEDALQLLEV